MTLLKQRQQMNMSASMLQSELVLKLWRHQTVNLLELFKAVSMLAQAVGLEKPGKEQEVRDVMEGLNTRLRAVQAGFGEMSLYLREEVEDDILALGSAQLKKNISQISEYAGKADVKSIQLYLDNIFGMLFVKVVKASKLPNLDAGFFKSSQDMTDACVVLRLCGQGREECPQTAVVKDDLNPTWDEEFILPVLPDQKKLTFEIFDSDEDQWVGRGRDEIGFVTATFRHESGAWIKRKEPVLSFKSSTPLSKSTFEYHLLFVNTFQQLLCMDPDDGLDAVDTLRLVANHTMQSVNYFLTQT